MYFEIKAIILFIIKYLKIHDQIYDSLDYCTWIIKI